MRKGQKHLVSAWTIDSLSEFLIENRLKYRGGESYPTNLSHWSEKKEARNTGNEIILGPGS